MDAFYASVEQRDDPELRGKPLIVGGDGSRGVVAAASYEVRKFGVHSAMPTREALRRCARTRSACRRASTHYAAVSRQIFAVFHEFTPLVQGLSLDEAFLDVTASTRALGSGGAHRARDQAPDPRADGLTASVGVAPNKLVAKIASDLAQAGRARDRRGGASPRGCSTRCRMRKLFGLGREDGAEGRGRSASAPSASCGRPRRRGCGRCSAATPSACSSARRASTIGRSCADVDEKQISAEETFDDDIATRRGCTRRSHRLADKACRRLRAKRLVAGCVTVKIRRGDFTTLHAAAGDRAAHAGDARGRAQSRRNCSTAGCATQPGRALRLLGVGVSDLAEQVQGGSVRRARVHAQPAARCGGRSRCARNSARSRCGGQCTRCKPSDVSRQRTRASSRTDRMRASTSRWRATCGRQAEFQRRQQPGAMKRGSDRARSVRSPCRAVLPREQPCPSRSHVEGASRTRRNGSVPAGGRASRAAPPRSPAVSSGCARRADGPARTPRSGGVRRRCRRNAPPDRRRRARRRSRRGPRR